MIFFCFSFFLLLSRSSSEGVMALSCGPCETTLAEKQEKRKNNNYLEYLKKIKKIKYVPKLTGYITLEKYQKNSY